MVVRQQAHSLNDKGALKHTDGEHLTLGTILLCLRIFDHRHFFPIGKKDATPSRIHSPFPSAHLLLHGELLHLRQNHLDQGWMGDFSRRNALSESSPSTISLSPLPFGQTLLQFGQLRYPLQLSVSHLYLSGSSGPNPNCPVSALPVD